MAGRRQAAERAHKARAWLAWHIAALTRAKKLPPIGKLTGGAKGAPRAQKPSEMLAFMRELQKSGVPMTIRKVGSSA